MKAQLIHDMTNDELNTRLEELKTELFNLRFRHAASPLENPTVLRNVKRDIARIKTVITERELGIKRGGKK